MRLQIDLFVLPWPCAVAASDGTLRQTNALWRERFGASDDLSLSLPEAMEKLRDVAQIRARAQNVTSPIAGVPANPFFDCALRAPGELATISMRFVALSGGETSDRPTAGEDSWLLAVGESSGHGKDGSSSAATQDLPQQTDETREVERELDGVVLRLQARHWRAFFRDAAAGKALLCLRGQTLEVNAALCQLTGYCEAELLEVCARDLRHPDDSARVEAHYQSILDGGPSVSGVESRYRHKDGHDLTCLLSITLIRDSRGRPLYFAVEIEDITLRRHVENRLVEQTRQLEYLNRELLRSNADLERFAFVASHDLQEPLRKIRVFGDRLLSARLDAEGAALYIDGMTRAARRMQNLIENLLFYGRLNDRSNPFAPVDLNELWEQLRAEFDDALRESGARLDVAALPTVSGNAFRLKQLFANLLSNALKFRGEQPLRIRVSATMGASAGADDDAPAWACIEVGDNGIGFEQAEADAIFEVFARLNSRSKYPGTGIGLAICRRVAREHGGDIRARASLGQGARFFIDLPLDAANLNSVFAERDETRKIEPSNQVPSVGE